MLSFFVFPGGNSRDFLEIAVEGARVLEADEPRGALDALSRAKQLLCLFDFQAVELALEGLSRNSMERITKRGPRHSHHPRHIGKRNIILEVIFYIPEAVCNYLSVRAQLYACAVALEIGARKHGQKERHG